jgi:hypothetical protein
MYCTNLDLLMKRTIKTILLIVYLHIAPQSSFNACTVHIGFILCDFLLLRISDIENSYKVL